MSKLSGGQKSRVVLCAISWAEPTFLILDECALAARPSPLVPCPSPLAPRPSNALRRCWAPAGSDCVRSWCSRPTNHLDMETVDVLATAVREFAGAVLVVSHDTYFLRHAANKFWSLRDGAVAEFQELDEAARHARTNKTVELD